MVLEEGTLSVTARPVDGEASHGTGSTRHADEWLLVTLLIDSSPRHHGRPAGLVRIERRFCVEKTHAGGGPQIRSNYTVSFKLGPLTELGFTIRVYSTTG